VRWPRGRCRRLRPHHRLGPSQKYRKASRRLDRAALDNLRLEGRGGGRGGAIGDGWSALWPNRAPTGSGSARFGAGWHAAVLAIIAGSFLFLDHAVLPHWKNASVMATFAVTMLLVAGLAFFLLKTERGCCFVKSVWLWNSRARRMMRFSETGGRRFAVRWQADDVAAGNRRWR